MFYLVSEHSVNYDNSVIHSKSASHNKMNKEKKNILSFIFKQNLDYLSSSTLLL